MVYGKYKNVRNASWQCLIDYGISSFPVRLSEIAQKEKILIVKNSLVNRLSESEQGISLYDGQRWIIIYDDTKSTAVSRFTIAHELGHIFLGHELKKGYHARTFEKQRPEIEQEADMFAIRLLAPACVLWGLNLHTPEEIAKICNISYSSALIRAERMEVLYQRNKFLSAPLERQVYAQFEAYTKIHKKKNRHQSGNSDVG